MKKKVVVVFLDAGTFDVINPLLKRGRLSTFGKMMKRGASGVLLSTMLPITPLAWASFATGVNPGKHGVFDLWDINRGNVIPVSSQSIRGETLWSLLNKANMRVVLMNAPLTYPPRKVKGLIITGFMTPSDVPCTYPDSFKKELLKEFPDYRVYTQTPASANECLFLEEAYNLLEMRCDVTLYLMENYDWDFFVSYFFQTDAIQHAFWKYMDPSHPAHKPEAPRLLREAIAKAYEIVDVSVKKILKTIDKDTLLIVMSDHGAGPLYKHVFLNNYLKKLGMIKMSMEGITRFNISRLLKASQEMSRVNGDRFPKIAEKVTEASRTIFDAIFKKRKRLKESSRLPVRAHNLLRLIDWTQTKAYAAGSYGQIFVNYDILKPAKDYEKLIKYLIQKLYELKDPESGAKIVDTVLRRSEIYQGPYVGKAPDLTLVMRGMTYRHTIHGYDFIGNRISEPTAYSAWHRMEGILIMYGKGIRSGYTLTDCNIVDLAPTILYYMGLEIPSDMDGKVLVRAFTPSYAKAHPVRLQRIAPTPAPQERYTLSKEEKQKLIERLKALGYIE